MGAQESIHSIPLSLSRSPVRRKKLLTTAQYIYKTFYIEERNSDISVMALGKVWHLHKIYLCQSPYFSSMFNGSWREREQKFIAIEIIDPKITLDCEYRSVFIVYIHYIIYASIGVFSAERCVWLALFG